MDSEDKTDICNMHAVLYRSQVEKTMEHTDTHRKGVRERGRARDNRKHYDAPNRKNDAYTHTKYLHLNDKMELKIISKQLKRKVSLTE